MPNTFHPIVDRRIRIALVGCGRISRNHIKAIALHHERSELVAICDTEQERLDTAKQLVEKDITLYYGPHGQIFKQFLLKSPITEYQLLGENFLIAKDWDQYMSITKHEVMEIGKHAVMSYSISSKELAVGRWHRSKEIHSRTVCTGERDHFFAEFCAEYRYSAV